MKELIVLHCVNQNSFYIASNHTFQKRTMHIVDCHFIIEVVMRGDVSTVN